MSVAVAVILECGRMPEGVVAPEEHCGGQNVALYLWPLAEIAALLGVQPLEFYFVFPE